MTIVASFLPRHTDFPIRRERLTLPDGDFVDLDWVGLDASNAQPGVILLHGLEGSVDSGYIRGLLGQVCQRGWWAVVMHFRGCSGEPNRARRAYHSGETEDVRLVIEHVRKKRARGPLAVVGYSLGGNVLLKHLGEAADEAQLDAAVAVSVPLMLAPCAERLQQGASRIYDRYLLANLKASLRRKMAVVDLGLPNDVQDRMTCIKDFDEYVTAPLHGFAGADDYYARSSSRPYLKHIRIPTLILHARDDPFMTEAILPKADELAASVTMEVSEKGGHVGFIAGRNPLRPKFWLDERIGRFLDARFS